MHSARGPVFHQIGVAIRIPVSVIVFVKLIIVWFTQCVVDALSAGVLFGLKGSLRVAGNHAVPQATSWLWLLVDPVCQGRLALVALVADNV